MQRRRDKTLPPPQMISSFVRVCFVKLILYRIRLSFILYTSVYRYTIYTRRRLAAVRRCLINGYTSETERKRSPISIEFFGVAIYWINQYLVAAIIIFLTDNVNSSLYFTDKYNSPSSHWGRVVSHWGRVVLGRVVCHSCYHVKNLWFHGKHMSTHQISLQNPVNSHELSQLNSWIH